MSGDSIACSETETLSRNGTPLAKSAGGGIAMSLPVLLLAVALAAAGASQQTSATPPAPSSNASDDRLATLAPPVPVVVEGCVETRREVTGHASDVGERTGINDHFVLTGAKVIKGKAPAIAAAAAGPATYSIDGFTDEQLTLHIGRRVRIDGTFGSLDRGATPADPKHADFLELTATTIRQVPGDCSIPKS
jgi:hypothetical protein